jgi:hypothetical protein
MCIRGSNIADYDDWTTTPANNVFEHILEGSGRIVGAAMLGAYVAVWTDTSCYLGQFIGSGGQTYRFRLKGLGVGELGASKINAAGEVYGLKRVLDFPGAYSQFQVSATGPERGVGTGLWLRNSHGVRLNLRAQRQGLQLSIAADGLIIEMS